MSIVFQLTRPVRGEPIPRDITLDIVIISTHSPRAGRTPEAPITIEAYNHFNSLAPCGANPHATMDVTQEYNFNSLAPCGANLMTRSAGASGF